MSLSAIQARNPIPARSFVDSIAPALNNEERLGFIGTRTLVQQSAPQPSASFRPSRLSYIRSFFERSVENLTTLRTEARRSMHERHAIADLSRDIGEVIRFLMEKQEKFDPKKDARHWEKLRHSFDVASALCGSSSEKAKLFPEILAKHFAVLSAEQELSVRNALTKMKNDNELFYRSHGVVDQFEHAVKDCVAQSMRKPLEYLFSAASDGDVDSKLLQDVVMALDVHGGFDASEIQQQFKEAWKETGLKEKFALLEASIGNDTVFAECESLLASTLNVNPGKKNWWEGGVYQAKLVLSKALSQKLETRQKEREDHFVAKCSVPESLYDDELQELMELGGGAYGLSLSLEKLSREYSRRGPIRAQKETFMPDHAVRDALLYSYSSNSFMRMYEGLFKLKRYVGQQLLICPQSKPSEILRKLFAGFDPIEKMDLTSDAYKARLVAFRAALQKEGGKRNNEFVKLLNCLFEAFQINVESASTQEKISPMALKNTERVFKFLNVKPPEAQGSRDDDGVDREGFGKRWSAAIKERVGTRTSAPRDANELARTHESFVYDLNRHTGIFFDGKPFVGFGCDSPEAMISHAYKKILHLTEDNHDQAGALMMVLNQSIGNSLQAPLKDEPLFKLSSDKLRKPEAMSIVSPDESSLFPMESDVVFNVSRCDDGQVLVRVVVYGEELSRVLDMTDSKILMLDKNTSSFFLEAEFLVDRSGNVSAPILGEYEIAGHVAGSVIEAEGYESLRNASVKNKKAIQIFQEIKG